MKLIYRQLFFSLFIFLSYSSAHAAQLDGAQCVPDLGSGNICTAKDFVLTELVIDGPASCTEGETVPQPIMVRVGVDPTANERYDIGFFIGENGEPAIEGRSCTFSSLNPIEIGSNFDGDSGSGPYRDLDANQCGDTLKTDATVYRDITLNNVLCVDSDNNGKLDIDYALTWQQQARSCSDPLNESNFFPPTSSKCKAQIGNLDEIIVVPPEINPAILINKTAAPNSISEPGGDILYSIEIINDGTEILSLTEVSDDKFGDINGLGDCSIPPILEPMQVYTCSFIEDISGAAPDTHINTVTVNAADIDDPAIIVTDSDRAVVQFLPVEQPSATIGDLVWNDLNADGFHTDDEPGIAGVILKLFQDAGSGYINPAIATVITLADGHYEFRDLAAGTYRVIPDNSLPPINHMIQTAGISPHDDIILAQHEHYLQADFGYSQAMITVSKTPVQHIVTAPSAAVTYDVIVNNSAALEVTLTQLIDNVFGDLSAKGCTLPQTPLSAGDIFSCQFTETITGSSGDTHENTVTALALDNAQNVIVSSDSAKVIFIDAALGAIGHSVWNDLDADGAYDPGEPGFDDVTLSLSGDASGITTTQNGGLYSFSHLAAGDYTVTVTDTKGILSNYVLTTNPNQPYTTTLSAGNMIDEQANFGYAKAQLEISKTADKNIVFSGHDVDFTIIVTNTGVIDLTITQLVDSVFDLSAAGCNMPQSLPAGNSYTCSFTQAISGSSGDIHKNVATVTAQDSDKHIFSASDNENIAIISGGAIGNLVWFDADDDGIKDDNEPGIAGITLDLIQNGNVIKSTTTDSEGHYLFTAANGAYEVMVTDTAHILDRAVLSSGSTNPHLNITINDDIISTVNFGYKLPPAPLPRPHINVTKTGSASTINSPKPVTFSVSVNNTGPVDVTLNELIDTVFGSLDGKGNCTIGAVIAVGGTYSCSFTEIITGSEGDIHRDIVIAVAKDSHQQIALGADDWFIDFLAPLARNIPTLSTLGIFLLISLVLLFVYRKNKAVKIT